MLSDYIDTLNSRMPPNLDAGAIADLFAAGGVHGHAMGVPAGVKDPQKGRDEIAAFFARFDKNWANWTHVERNRTVEGRRAVWEGVAQGTHKASGKSVRAPIVFSLEFNDEGKATNVLVYFNGAMVAAQLK